MSPETTGSTPSRRAAFSFGLSGLSQNLVGTCLGVHLFLFYTDIVGLSPLWVSGGLFAATLWDAVSDVAMGRISDGTRWKAGRRRPFILLGALPVGLAFWLLLSPPRALEGNALGVYFVLTLLFLFTAKTVALVPALSLLPEMAKGYHERTRLAAAHGLLGNVGDLLGLMLPLALLLVFAFDEAAPNAADTARDAYGTAAVIGGTLATLALLVTWRGTREDRRVHAAPGTTLDALRALRGNRSFRILLGAGALGALGLAFVQALILYVFNHVLEERDPTVHMAAFALNAVAAIASYPFWTWLSKRRGKPFAFRAGLALSVVTFSSVFFIGAHDLVGLGLVMVFAGVANVGFWMLLPSLSADVVDLDELEHGERREGLFAGFSALLRKCAFAAAAGGLGLGLALIHYQEGVAQQSPETVQGLQILFAGPPTLLLLGSLLWFSRFELSREAHAEILAQLAGRARPEIELPAAPVTLPEAA